MSAAAVEAVRDPAGGHAMELEFSGTLRFAKSVGLQHPHQGGAQMEHSKSPDGVHQQDAPARELSLEILEPPGVQSGSTQEKTASGGKNIPECPVCGKKSNLPSLELHVENHGKPGGFRCAVCDVRCPNKDQRKKHEIASHSLVRDKEANAVPGARLHAKLKLTKNFAEVQAKAKRVGSCTAKRAAAKKTAKGDSRPSGPTKINKQKGNLVVIRHSIVNVNVEPQPKPPEQQATNEKQTGAEKQAAPQKSADQPQQAAKKKPEESRSHPERENSVENRLLRAMGRMREVLYLDAMYFKDEAVGVVDQWVKKTTGRLLVVRSAKKYWKDGLKPADVIKEYKSDRSHFLIFTKSKDWRLFREFEKLRRRDLSVYEMVHRVLSQMPSKDAFIAANREDRKMMWRLNTKNFHVYHA